MGLNKVSGNMYEFITHTWNPIRGECFHDCSYCYIKAMSKRYGVDRKQLQFVEKEMKTKLGKGNYIFVGSSTDMFSEMVKDEWIEKVLELCGSHIENKYLFQSKNVGRMAKFKSKFQKNSIIATTVESNREYEEYNNSPAIFERIRYLTEFENKMITIEPIMKFDIEQLVNFIYIANPQQVNIGADSGNNNLWEPEKHDIEKLIFELSKFTTVVQKKNLARLLK
jgi:DNA repair photolyase